MAEMWGRNRALLLNSTQQSDRDVYNWCTDYFTGPVIWAAISVICFLLGFPASLCVLHELLQKRRQRSTSDMFMLSLAAIDLIFTLQIPFCVFNFMLWHIKELHLFLSFIYNLSLSRPLFMACICWDSYVAVVHPIVFKTDKKLLVIKQALTVAIFFFTVVCGLAICIITWLITTPSIGIPLFMALPVITYCDVSILRALRKPDPTGKSSIHPQKKQALYTISNSFIMTFVIYLPPTIIFLLGNLMALEEKVIFCCLAPFGFCFSTAGCVIMPVLYLNSVGKLDRFMNWWKK